MARISPDYVIHLYLRGPTPQVEIKRWTPETTEPALPAVSFPPLTTPTPSPTGTFDPAEPCPVLTLVEETTGETYPLNARDQLQLGRDEHCDVVVTHPRASRLHAELQGQSLGCGRIRLLGSGSIRLNGAKKVRGDQNIWLDVVAGDRFTMAQANFRLDMPTPSPADTSRDSIVDIGGELASSSPKALEPRFRPSQSLPAEPGFRSQSSATAVPVPLSHAVGPVAMGLNDVSHLPRPTPVESSVATTAFTSNFSVSRRPRAREPRVVESLPVGRMPTRPGGKFKAVTCASGRGSRAEHRGDPAQEQQHVLESYDSVKTQRSTWDLNGNYLEPECFAPRPPMSPMSPIPGGRPRTSPPKLEKRFRENARCSPPGDNDLIRVKPKSDPSARVDVIACKTKSAENSDLDVIVESCRKLLP